ncbi:MAG: DUF255 domain-containing protein [Phycisphaeraceae bacterium]|nr:DUF255 domain-containing protein [Phycisphaeraceae bacterium]
MGQAGHKNPDGSWAYTNVLVHETSPYLQQHGHDPVHWLPWGDLAFERARRQQLPIFLSIGYSTCYWCHVMQRLVFNDLDIATYMNEHFVNIKVDREERPDVDDLYMTATQVMTRKGGWPMSVFLTPPEAEGPGAKGLKPFFCGTYFPPEAVGRMPGFGQVLESMHRAWMTQREVVLNQADELMRHVRSYLEVHRAAGQLDAGSARKAAEQLMKTYDREHGGFGAAPKFPTPNHLAFLLARPEPERRAAVHHTLHRMAHGGIYDHVGGGFHRYSTDEVWLVPHFEKMLYDNGQLMELYADALADDLGEAHAPLYGRVLRETGDYVLREMTNPSGGASGGCFYCAQDAEVNTFEGGSYLWTKQQVEETIDDPELRVFALKLYGLDGGPNFRDPHHRDAEPCNVLYLPTPLEELGPDAAEKRQKINALLKQQRDLRDQPATDDKVLVSWNGIMIAGLARAGAVLKESRFIQAATRAADFIMQHMIAPDGSLLRLHRQGKARVPAFLEDYAFFVHGLLSLHQATGEVRFREAAEKFTDIAIERFVARGKSGGGEGYYDTLDEQQDMILRTRGIYDGAIPSGASQMVHNLLDLGRHERALADLRSYSGELARYGQGMAHMQHALMRALALSAASVVSARVSPIDSQAGRFHVDLTIAAGYHLNANPASDDKLVATTLSGAEVIYPLPQQKRYAFADRELSVYESSARLTVKVDPAALPTQLTLTYQPCTDHTCEAPATLQIPLS